jgi:broad specificity phosphatase PhoE
VRTTVHLVRHGETDWNRERRFQGHADIPLNEAGLEQARVLAASLDGERFSAVYTSPLRRAVQTAEILAARLGVAAREHEALKEVDVGSWSGYTVPEIQARFPEGFARWVDWRTTGWEDGEHYEQFSRRVVGGVLEVAERHAGGRLLAVTHGGPIRALLAAARGLEVHEVHATVGPLSNCAVVHIAVREGKIEAVD